MLLVQELYKFLTRWSKILLAGIDCAHLQKALQLCFQALQFQ